MGGCRSKQELSPEARIDAALAKSTHFLLSMQGEDGAFRSRTYAAFKDGYSLTPLVLTALRFAPPSDAQAAAYRRGVDFVATLVDQSGALTSGLDGPRYPTYSIATAILVLNVRDNARHAAVREALVRELEARQLTEERGFDPAHPSYGGWGYFAGIPDRGAASLPELAANLSSTIFAIGALRLGNAPPDAPALAKARVFVERCQNFGSGPHDDGGFFFSPELADGNKAGVAGQDADGRPRYRSYGSMTADGLRALLRLGLPVDHPRVQAASAWLEQHYAPGQNPGVFPARDEVRRESAYFYYVWTSAHALRHLNKAKLATAEGELAWAQALAAELIRRQRPDGSWANEFTEMREDDPILATAMAMAGLALARSALSSEYRSHSAAAQEMQPPATP